MTEPAAVIFDVDGVLVDSYLAHFQSWQQTASEAGYSMSESQFAATFGRTSREVIRELWSDGSLSHAQIARWDERKEAVYREILQREFPVMDGAEQLIEALDVAGFRIAVGSSGPAQNVQLVLDHIDPGRRIQEQITGDDVTRGKPDPQVFQLAAERLQVPPQRCVVIEDAAAGVAAAHAAAMTCIALVSTGRTRQELASAEVIVSSLRELSPRSIRELISPGECP